MRFGVFPIAVALLAGCPGSGGSEVDCSTCDGATELCVITTSDVSTEPDTSSCDPVPDACADDVTCACLEGLAEDTDSSFNLDFCLSDMSGGCSDGSPVEVTCPGG